VEAELDALKPADAPEMAPGNETVDAALLDVALLDVALLDAALLDAATQMDIDPPEDEDEPAEDAPIPPQQNNEEGIKILQLTRRYHLDAINFTEIIHTASEAVSLLLSSKNKAEVIEAMDFFKIIDAYRVETSRVSIFIMPLPTEANNNPSIGRYPQNASSHLDQGQQRRRQGGAGPPH